MAPPPEPAVRLAGIVARRAPVAVVFRRGPTRHVELIRWDLAADTIERGQWLKGRIYERRSDLSPDGSLLVAFVATYETGLRTWTAISRPPFLSALALWPKGDAWGGGGLFRTQTELRLNHKANEMTADPEHQPQGLRVVPLEPYAGHGEDDPIHHERLLRDGWTFVDEPARREEHGIRRPIWITFDPPLRYRRPSPRAGGPVLERALEGIHERGGRWYVEQFRLLDRGRSLRELGRLDWADWDATGDLLIGADGRLARLPGDRLAAGKPVEIADLGADRFRSIVAPESATRW